jgi:hypothetical protein
VPPEGPRRDREPESIRELLSSPLGEPAAHGSRPRRIGWVAAGVAGAALVVAVGGVILAAGGDPDPASGGGPANGAGPGMTTDAATTTLAPAGFPDPRSMGRLAFDERATSVLLLGGQTILSPAAELMDVAWRFDPLTRLWRPLAWLDDLVPRTGHAMTYVDSVPAILVFGGAGGLPTISCPAGSGRVVTPLYCTREVSDEMWLVDLSAATVTEVDFEAGPPARSGHAMAYDPAADRVVLFGGHSGAVPPNRPLGEYLDDTWVYDPSAGTWHEVHSGEGPAARAWHTLVHDPATGRVYLFGGVAERIRDSDDEVWAFDLSDMTWSRLEIASEERPRARWMHQMVLEPASGRLMMVGGQMLDQGYQCPPEVWEFDPTVPQWELLSSGDGFICFHAVAPLGDGSVLLATAGGFGIYNHATGVWTDLSPP